MLASLGIKYPSKLHSEKVASFLSPKATHHAILLAKGTESLNRDNTDTELDFRQESNFFYLTGVQESDCYYIYDFDNRLNYLVVPDLDLLKAVWKGPTPTDQQLLMTYDVDRVVRYSDFLKVLKHEIMPHKILGWNNPDKVHPFEDKAQEHELQHYISHRLIDIPKRHRERKNCQHHQQHHYHHHHQHDHHGYRGHKGRLHNDKDEDSEGSSLLEALILARVNKSPIEIALSREASRITSDAHRLVMHAARPGMFEYQLEALFRYECGRQGARPQAYLPIVGSSVNAAYLHYTRNDTEIKDGDLVLIDAACEVDCYGSDVTRTFPVNGRFTSDQRDIYDLVLKMQTTILNRMERNVEWQDMAKLSQKIGLFGLKDLDILVGDNNDLLESGIIKVFYPHGLGHLLGLNVHDDGLGLVVQKPIPEHKWNEATESSDGNQPLAQPASPVNLHSLVVDDSDSSLIFPPPSTRRMAAMKTNGSYYATPSTKLEPGMVLTVEPGIYFNPAQIEIALATPYLAQYMNEPVLRRYMSVGGVRIEDVVLIRPDGKVDNLTTAPKNPKEIEQIVQGVHHTHQVLQRDGLSEDIMNVKVMSEGSPPLADVVNTAPQGIKKRVSVFKKILKALRRLVVF
ncbi:hypothetical protein BG004_007512 [Podila humilis]|nr:hypothetical protein BG004_007512 [Podila humilis]